MPTRSASPSILGYLYQFDRAALALLRLTNDQDSVTLEGIEDIDVYGAGPATAIQCKYYEAQTYAPSKIREPLQWMLLHSQEATKPIRYTLYMHFGVGSLPPVLDLSSLKAILSYSEKGIAKKFHKDNKITDRQLTSFLGRLSLTPGPSYSDQSTSLQQELAKALIASAQDVQDYHYPLCLNLIAASSVKPTEDSRRLTRLQFLQAVDKRKVLLDRWLMQFKGAADSIKFVKTQLGRLHAIVPQKRRFLVVSKGLIAATGAALPVSHFIRNLVDNSFRPGKTLHDARPWTICLDIPDHEVASIKSEVIGMDLSFSDGYESISFSPTLFDKEVMIHRAKVGSKTSDRIGDASFRFRFISAETLLANFDLIQRPDSIIVAGLPGENVSQFLDLRGPQLMHVSCLSNLGDLQAALS